MNKIHIICDRNEETNEISIQSIILLKNGEQPNIIEYKGILDLISVMDFAEENEIPGISNGIIKSALDGGFLNIVLQSNKEKLSEVRAEVLKANIDYEVLNQEKIKTLNNRRKKANPTNTEEFVEAPIAVPTNTEEFVEEPIAAPTNTEELEEEPIAVPTNTEETEEVTMPHVRPTGKLKQFVKKAATFVVTVVTAIIGHELYAYFTNKKTTPPQSTFPIEKAQEQTITQAPINTNNQSIKDVPNVTEQSSQLPINNSYENVQIPVDYQGLISNFAQEYNTNSNTLNFLNSPQVLDLLSNYKNSEQIKEVLSALSYGYEANILNVKSGNFRLAEDGNDILQSFTKDFMSAKAFVNNYDSQKLLTLTGGKDITYEVLLNGFENYCHTLRTYGLNAVEKLPFHYLTNNDSETTELMNDLFDKLVVVNKNRENGTLTNEHTDDFIAKTFNIFVENNQSTHISEGAKTVLASMVDSFTLMQSNVANKDALYLHEDRGYAKAGINLNEVNGQFTFKDKDKTTYEFISLFDAMNHEYGKINNKCIIEQERMINAILDMNNTSSISQRKAKDNLITSLYNNNYGVYAEAVSENKVNEELLTKIVRANPLLSNEVEEYRESLRSNSNSDLVGFKETYEKIDSILGLKGKTNPYNNLINIRRSRALNAKYNGILHNSYENMPSMGLNYPNTISTNVVEQVSFDKLTPSEQSQANDQISNIQATEQTTHQAQMQQINQGVDALRNGVQAGQSQAQLEQIAEVHGITLDPNYQENMSNALKEQQEAEERRKAEEQAILERNAEAERIAREQAEKEKAEQQLRYEQELSIINGETSSTVIDLQMDPNFGTEDEEVYIPTSSKKDLLNELRKMALSAPVDVKTKSLKYEKSA